MKGSSSFVDCGVWVQQGGKGGRVRDEKVLSQSRKRSVFTVSLSL